MARRAQLIGLLFAVRLLELPVLAAEARAAPAAYEYFLELKAAREKRDYATMSNIVARFETPDAVEPVTDRAQIYFIGADAFSMADRSNHGFQRVAYQLSLQGRRSLSSETIPGEVRSLSRNEGNWSPAQYSSQLDDRTFVEARAQETELVLKAWHRLQEELKRTADIVPPSLGAFGVILDMLTEEERAENSRNVAMENYLTELRRNGEQFVLRTPGSLAMYYSHEPVDFDELLGLVHQRMGPEAVEGVWTNVFKHVPAKLKPAASQAYVRYQVLGPDIRRPEAVPPVVARGPSLPAIARPSARRGTGAGVAPVASGAGNATAAGISPADMAGGQEESRPVWPWAVLGLVVLGGGWGWVKMRS